MRRMTHIKWNRIHIIDTLQADIVRMTLGIDHDHQRQLTPHRHLTGTHGGITRRTPGGDDRRAGTRPG